jgi:hypothetical protein
MFNFDFGDSWSSQNSQSPLLRGGTQMDPLVGLFPGLGKWKIKTGDKLQNWVSDNIAKKDPLIKKDRAHGLASWSKEARGISDWAQEKPLDATALVVGGVLGGGALAGGWGAGGGAAGGGAAGGTAGSTAGGLGAAGTTAGFMPGSAAGGAAGLEGVTVVGSSGGAGLSAGSAAALTAAGVPGAVAAQPQGQGNQWKDWLDRMSKMQSQGGGQQQQQSASIQQGRQPNGARPTGTWDKIKAGLGRVGENMFPIDQAYGASPAEQQAMRKNALLQMGLGMMAASSNGAGFGEAAAFGLGKAQNNLTGALQRGYENARENRQEQRQKEQDERQLKRDEVSDNRWASEMGYRQEQDRIQNEQQQRAYDRAIGNDERSESWARLKYEQDDNQFDRSIKLREQEQKRQEALLGAGAVPSGYRRAKDGNLEPIKGGPADPQNKTGNFQEAERTAAFLGTRLADALGTLKTISTDDQTPGLAEKGLQAMGADTAANWVRGEDRQKANAAQRDALDAALTLATGAAYTKEQIDAMRESYFPQIGDTDAVKTDKSKRLDMLIEAAKVKAGRAADQIDKVLGKGQQAPAWGSDIQSLLDQYDPPR